VIADGVRGRCPCSRSNPGGSRRQGRWLVGVGVAASSHPANRRASQALARRDPDGRFVVRLVAADIGTGARTALTQIAADALDVAPDAVHVELGDSIGAKGIGEIGIVGTAAAIANAVYHATGIRIRDLPIRPDKLFRAQVEISDRSSDHSVWKVPGRSTR
jgi:xanthine dehydrogenase YagR molybdenum-binding subunit